MGWDEALFGYILKKISTRGREAERSVHALLDTEAPSLRLMAAAMTGEDLKICATEGSGGFDGDRLFLPSRIGFFSGAEDNRKAYLFRLLAGVAARELRLVLPVDEARTGGRTLRPAEVCLIRARIGAGLPRADDLLRELILTLAPRFPGSENAALEAPEVLSVLFGGLLPQGSVNPGLGTAAEAFHPESLASGTEKKGQARERAEEVRLGESKDDENPLIHVFEKVLTVDEYAGGKKNFDGSDELEEHEEALSELNLRHVIRSREKTRSIYKSDAIVDGGAPDLEDAESPASARTFVYDEWDGSKRMYRRDWCTVSLTTPPDDPDGGVGLAQLRPTAVRKLRAQLENLLNERRWRGRQLDGSEVDLDALVSAVTDRRCGATPSDHVYLARRRADRDFAASILIDVSLSTDAWVANRHVIEVTRQSVLTLAEIMDGLISNVSVAAFSSNTRRDCRFVRLKDFNEDWIKLRARMSALKPNGYTRIGPAIRHATTEFKKTGAKRKLLLLISDGKPTDYDRYEGTYGIEDVRQAIKEAQSAGLLVHSLAIDAEAKHYLPRMLGAGRYQILPSPDALAPALSRIFTRCLT